MTNYKRLGEAITLPYNGEIITFSDGSVFKLASPKTLAYSSEYSDLLTYAPSMVSSAVNLNGPVAGCWDLSMTWKQVIGPTSGTWVAISTNTNYYWTSADSGSTWTQRAWPTAGKTWTGYWDGTNYLIYANSSTTSGVYESTDAINWTGRTGVSLTAKDIIYNGSVYLVVGASSTGAATSPDRTTWTSRTTTTTGAFSQNPGLGFITWNAGAGLFIMSTSASNQYQTSPDGATWTSRTGAENYTFANGVIASSATRTVFVGTYGVAAYTNDGINWTSINMPSECRLQGVPQALYYQNSMFNLIFLGMSFYSTNGATWTKTTRANISTTAAATSIKTPTGFLSLVLPIGLHVTDLSSTANTSIVAPSVATVTPASTYYCIAEGTGGGTGGGLTQEEHDKLFLIQNNPLQKNYTTHFNDLRRFIEDKLSEIKEPKEIDLMPVLDKIDTAIQEIKSIEIPETIIEEKEVKKAIKLIQNVDKKLTSYIDSEMNEKDEIEAISREFTKLEMEENLKHKLHMEEMKKKEEEDKKKEEEENKLLLEEIKKEFDKQDEMEKEEKRKEIEKELEELEKEKKEKEKELNSL